MAAALIRGTWAVIDGGEFVVEIPRMAAISPYVRVVSTEDGSLASDWVLKGNYFIDTRIVDKKNGTLTIHGYDAMLKAEQTYMPSVSTGQMGTADIISEIAALLGVSVKSSTSTFLITHQWGVPYYAGQYTAREMLQYIGVSYAGNFIINEDGELELVA